MDKGSKLGTPLYSDQKSMNEVALKGLERKPVYFLSTKASEWWLMRSRMCLAIMVKMGALLRHLKDHSLLVSIEKKFYWKRIFFFQDLRLY